MGFSHMLARQLARPHGLSGRLLGRAMDAANRRPVELAIDLLEAQEGEMILDAGCGTGAALAAAAARADIHLSGIDPSPTMIAAARRRLGPSAELDTVTIEEMPFADETFDAILLLNVLYFAGHDAGMVANLHRVLRPGGRLIAYVTHRETMRRWPFARAGIHRLYDADELVDMLAQGGFGSNRISVQEVQVAQNVDGLIARATR